MISLSSLWAYYALGIVTLLVSYILGKVVFTPALIRMQLNEVASTFFSLVMGLCLLVSVFAIWATQFSTVMIALPVFIGALVYSIRKHSQEVSMRRGFIWHAQSWVFLLTAYTFFFLLKWWLLFADAGPLATPHPDELFAAKLSVFIEQTGVENFSLDYFNVQEQHPQPYHYFEIWLAALVGSFPGVHNLYALLFDVYVLLCAVCALGLAGVLTTITNRAKGAYVLVFSVGAVMFSGIHSSVFNKLPLLDAASVFARHPLNYSKLIVVYLFLVVSFQLFLAGQKRESLYSLLFLPIVFISTAPAIMAVVSIALLYYCWEAKSIRKSMVGIAMMAITVLLFFWLYLFQKIGAPAETASYHSGFFELNVLTIQYFRTAFNVVAGTSIVIFVMYLPLVVGVVMLVSKTAGILHSKLVWLATGTLALSLLAWAALHTMPDSVQLFSNISVSLLNLGSVLTVWYILTASSLRWAKFAASAGAIFMIVFSVADIAAGKAYAENPMRNLARDFASVLEAEKEILEKPGGYLREKEEYHSIFVKNSAFSTPAPYLSLWSDRQYLTSLSVYNIPLDSSSALFPFESKMVANAPFFKFVEGQKRAHTFGGLDQSMVAFIKINSIRYLVLTPFAKLPEAVAGLVSHEVINPINKERIIFLNY
jgi:hypothetical protein